MKCLECGGETKVINVAKDVDEVLRLRECAVCKTRFYTSETDVKFEDGKAAVNQIRNYKRQMNRGKKHEQR
jgi:transcriptional regulator NrdR family protein